MPERSLSRSRDQETIAQIEEALSFAEGDLADASERLDRAITAWTAAREGTAKEVDLKRRAESICTQYERLGQRVADLRTFLDSAED